MRFLELTCLIVSTSYAVLGIIGHIYVKYSDPVSYEARFLPRMIRSEPSNSADQLKILCWVLTINNPESRQRAETIRETWGQECDKLLLVENGRELRELKVGFDEPNVSILTVPANEEGRDQNWHKVTQALLFIQEHYINEYDWFLKTGDDTHVIMDTLRKILASKSQPEEAINRSDHIPEPYVFHRSNWNSFADYALNRKSLQLVVEQGLKKKAKSCYQIEGQVEKIEMGSCLKAINVTAGDTFFRRN